MQLKILCTAIGVASLISTAAVGATGHAGRGPALPMQSTPVMKMAAQPAVVARPTTVGPTRTGQPNQSCGSDTAPNTPGNAATAPGSAFNPSGTAGTVYAGQQPQNSRNSASVSQYDVACLHQPR